MSNKSVKILLIYAKSTEEVFNPKSALGSYIKTLSQLLNQKDCEVFLNGVAVNEIKAEKRATSTKLKSKGILSFLPKKLKSIARDIFLFLRHKKLFNSLLKHSDYDLILEMYSYGSNIGYKLSKTFNIPLVLVYDAPLVEEYTFFNETNPPLSFLINKREKQSLSYADFVVVYSNPVKQFLLKKYKDLTDKFGIHQNVDFSRLGFYERNLEESFSSFNIGFIGSFLKWHRVDLLLDVFEKIRENRINAKLYLLGEGQMHEEIKRRVNKCNFREDIIMPGFVDGEELEDYKKIINIGVMPSSNWYGAPNKIFEYGAAKMVVVAPGTPTIKDMFSHNENIIMFKNNDFSDLYQKLYDLLTTEPKMLCNLAQNLYNKVEQQHNKEATLRFYEGIINKALKR